jgi:sugar transferase (PEP-CTERM/EpsH1 system associated)
MNDLLFLVHRIPYPPNKGDKIRSFHLLQALATRYRVHVGAFIDTPEDLAHVEALRRMCASLLTVRIRPGLRKLAALRGLALGQPLTDIYYAHGGMAKWCAQTVQRHNIKHVVVFSSSMAQFVAGNAFAGVRRVMDFCDIDSDKWRQYADRQRGPVSWIYRREARLLLKLERRVAQDFDASLFVSELETKAFRELAPESAARVHAVRNGVDVNYFDPALPFAAPTENRYAVFTGAMDYWANVEGVSWFAAEVWPLVRAQLPDAKFLIVGSKPSEQVLRLATLPGIVVTGAVPDVRPYLRHAHVSVAPLRVARGIQNKVLEAMAMERVVVAAAAAVQGLDARPPDDVPVTDDAVEFAAKVTAALQQSAPPVATANRRYAVQRFSWAANLQALLTLVEGAA